MGMVLGIVLDGLGMGMALGIVIDGLGISGDRFEDPLDGLGILGGGGGGGFEDCLDGSESGS